MVLDRLVSASMTTLWIALLCFTHIRGYQPIDVLFLVISTAILADTLRRAGSSTRAPYAKPSLTPDRQDGGRA